MLLMEKKTNKLFTDNKKLIKMENFGKFITIVLSFIITTLVGGFVFMKLWAWFIVSIFHLPSLNIIEAIGVMMIINYATHRSSSKTEKSENPINDFLSLVITNIIISLLVLLIGWILSFFL